MMIHKTTLFVNNNQWLKRLDTQIIELANENSLKVPKVVKLTNKNHQYKTLGTSVINDPTRSWSLISRKHKLNTSFFKRGWGKGVFIGDSCEGGGSLPGRINFIVKDNHIGSVVSLILQNRHTDRQRTCYLYKSYFIYFQHLNYLVLVKWWRKSPKKNLTGQIRAQRNR